MSGILRSWLDSARIVLVEPHDDVRARLLSHLVALGADARKVVSLTSLLEALPRVAGLKPDLLVAHCGSEIHPGTALLRKQKLPVRVAPGAPTPGIGVLIAKTPAEAKMVCSLADAGLVDLLLTLPFSLDDFGLLLARQVLDRKRRAGDARSEVELRRLDDAIRHFDVARAHGRGAAPVASGRVLGLFESLVANERWTDAYALARAHIGQSTQLQERLDEVIHLAVRTHAWEDIASYHKIFVTLERRGAALTRTLFAALCVAARHFIESGKADPGKELLIRAGILGLSDSRRLRLVVGRLAEVGEFATAQALLERVPNQDRGKADFLALEYQVQDGLQKDLAWSVHAGWRLLRERGVLDPLVYEVLIRRLHEAGKVDAAEHLAHDASVRWPQNRAGFLRIVA